MLTYVYVKALEFWRREQSELNIFYWRQNGKALNSWPFILIWLAVIHNKRTTVNKRRDVLMNSFKQCVCLLKSLLCTLSVVFSLLLKSIGWINWQQLSRLHFQSCWHLPNNTEKATSFLSSICRCFSKSQMLIIKPEHVNGVPQDLNIYFDKN